MKKNSKFFYIFPECRIRVLQIARQKARCDYGIFVGASAANAASVALLAKEAFALKMYLNETFTTLRMDHMTDWIKVGVT